MNGGGVWNVGTLTLNGKSRIRDNIARSTGAGDPISPTGIGGGVWNARWIHSASLGRVVLNGSSSITGNAAEIGGGGIAYSGDSAASSFFACAPTDGANIHGNTPDDCYIE